ncbi:MAG: glycosyl transferase family 28 [candidate division NC10 bacterium]|jgi:UDP:flavonoid glycosyltransferase YjiC (YdhE family)|nr:glycosyl transferase family 28 [candidate division NC10 bacterium]
MHEPRKFVLVPAGSAGDIHPFVWLGKGLASLGHEVVVVVHRPFDRTMEGAGLRTLAYGTDEDFKQIIRHADLWHPRRGFELIARVAPRLYPEIVPRVRTELVPGRTLLVGAGIAFGARIAAEAFGAPLVTVQLQPVVFMSAIDPPVIGAGFEWFRLVPRWTRRALYWLGDLQSDRLLAPGINAYREQVGLRQPVRKIMRNYWNSPLQVLALFPDWYGTKQADWPAQTVVTRFPLYDESDQVAVPPDLERFLTDGPPPVLFTPGSANIQARRFFEVGLEACRRLGFRGLFVTRYAEQLPSVLPPEVRHFAYVPFGQVFRRCAALVHHGGIGTVAQGLAAGVPQLVMAMSHDQPDNGFRLTRLGVGAYLYPKAFTPDRVAAALGRLTGSPEVARACRACRELVEKQMPAEDVFRILEETHRRTCG